MMIATGRGGVGQKREKLVHFNVFQVDRFFQSDHVSLVRLNLQNKHKPCGLKNYLIFLKIQIRSQKPAEQRLCMGVDTIQIQTIRLWTYQNSQIHTSRERLSTTELILVLCVWTSFLLKKLFIYFLYKKLYKIIKYSSYIFKKK